MDYWNVHFLPNFYKILVKDTIKFTGLHIPARSELVYFQVYMTLLRSCLPLLLTNVRPPLIEGISNALLTLPSLDTRFIVKIILVNICTEENKKEL